jgi:hypothetical protein
VWYCLQAVEVIEILLEELESARNVYQNVSLGYYLYFVAKTPVSQFFCSFQFEVHEYV